MTRKQIYSKASDVSAEEGVVNVDGPDGVDVGLTPEAALETSNRLLDGAMHAAAQRHRSERLTGGTGRSETRRPGDTSSDTSDESRG